jgi:hypothetical protein
MLPKNTFRDRRLERLKITTGSINPWATNVLKVYAPESNSSVGGIEGAVTGSESRVNVP